MKTDTPRKIHLKDYRPPDFLIEKVDLDVQLNPTRTRVKSRLTVRPNPKAKKKSSVIALDGELLELDEVRLNGKVPSSLDYSVSKTKLTIKKVPAKLFRLEIITFVNPDENTALQGIYRSRDMYCSQCEAQGFRRITYFLDRPDVLSKYKVRVESDRETAPILLSNGNLVDQGNLDGGQRHYAVWHDPHPKPCYLFALVGGDLSAIASKFTTMSGKDVDLNVYVEHGKDDRAHWAMESLKRSMKWDEERFGREYDLDVFNIVAVSDFNMGAMENKGLNIFNDRLVLASPETATDNMFVAIESVVAHEYFHNWTGNRITCRDWFQLCLKEGLTVYRDQEFSADARSRTVHRIMDVRLLRANQFPEDAGPLSHPVRPESYIEINNFYTATVYEKGAELVRMIETILGREDFDAGLQLYFDRHDGDAATIEDFLACFAEASGRNLTQFQRWYSQPGTPNLECTFTYDRKNKTAILKVAQSLPERAGRGKPRPLHIPIKIGLIGKDGHDLPLHQSGVGRLDDGVLHLTKSTQTFKFTDIEEKPVPSVLRGFSAPVNLSLNLSDDNLEFLIAHDQDPFNRWQAANTYATRTMVAIVKAFAKGKRTTRGAGYVKALSSVLADKTLEPSFKAELLKLPTQSDLAREMGRNVNPDHIFRAHRQLSRMIANKLGGQLESIHDTMKPRGAFSANSDATGKRALRNQALTLLMSRGSKKDIARAAEHFRKARNMTDQAHALILLGWTNAPERKAAFDKFFKRWKNDHVVIDTWFSAQAQSPRTTTLNNVKKLTEHPLFSHTTPNKVRALVGNFAMMNPVQFNRADGAGYEFVAEQVLAIDKVNPQIAARILGCFKSWRVLEINRRRLAQKALRRVSKAPDLSRDVFEIVSKMLEG